MARQSQHTGNVVPQYSVRVPVGRLLWNSSAGARVGVLVGTSMVRIVLALGLVHGVHFNWTRAHRQWGVVEPRSDRQRPDEPLGERSLAGALDSCGSSSRHICALMLAESAHNGRCIGDARSVCGVRSARRGLRGWVGREATARGSNLQGGRSSVTAALVAPARIAPSVEVPMRSIYVRRNNPPRLAFFFYRGSLS